MTHCARHDRWHSPGEGCLPCNEESPEHARNPISAEDVAEGYNAIKEFQGRKYTGMRVGGDHSWYYRLGEWRETKVTPDKWQFTFAAVKRRKWDAPKGSGAPVGVEYHWYILADQKVRKLNANEYTTSMTGIKYKLAHRRAGGRDWSTSDRVRLRRLIRILEENVARLERELGVAGKELGAAPRGAEPIGMTTDGRRKKMASARRTPPKDLPPGIMAVQLPLEAYTAS